jgi:deoxyribonuclease-1-like protein
MSKARARRNKARSFLKSNSTSLLPYLGTAIMGLAGYLGCELDSLQQFDPGRLPQQLSALRDKMQLPAHYVSTAVQSRGLPSKAEETILVASFNIQAFGESKMNDRWVMERLAEVIRRFDVVAIQEIRSKDQALLPNLLRYVNATGQRYDFLLGPRLGDTVSKEQYAYVYDADRIITNKQCTYTLNDDINALHREPLVGRFVVRTARTYQPWTFSLVNLHTDPDVAQQEVDAMGGILREIRNFEFASAGEDDVILLGDLNAGPEKLGNIQRVAGMQPVIRNQPTNVRGTQIYDNLVFDPTPTAEFTGHAGVLKLDEFFNITKEEALKLSDHHPIWAEFLVEERGPHTPAQPAPPSPFPPAPYYLPQPQFAGPPATTPPPQYAAQPPWGYR